MTDKSKILKWFKKRKYLTCTQAVVKLNVWNLRSRVCEIPGIVSEMVKVKRADGKMTTVARYSMSEVKV